MSYKCEKCGTIMGRWQKPTMVTVEMLQKTYPVRLDALGDVIDNGGFGVEITKEQKVCQICANKIQGRTKCEELTTARLVSIVSMGNIGKQSGMQTLYASHYQR